MSKVYIAWAKKVQRSYRLWNSRGKQSSVRNRLVVWKLAKIIWQILIWALKNLKDFLFNGLLLSKVYIVWAKQVQRSCLSSNRRGIQSLEKNRLVISKLTKGIWQILTWALRSLKDFRFNGVVKKRTKTNRTRGVVACVYVSFF